MTVVFAPPAPNTLDSNGVTPVRSAAPGDHTMQTTTTPKTHSLSLTRPTALRLTALILLAFLATSIARGDDAPPPLEGTITFIDPSRSLVVIQSRGLAKALILDPMPDTLLIGQSITIAGKHAPAPAYTSAPLKITGAQVTALGEGELQGPKHISIGRDWPAERNFLWSDVIGTVSFVSVENGTLFLELTESDSNAPDPDARMTLRVLHWGNHPAPTHLLNRRLRAQGVCEQVSNPKNEPTAGLLWVQDPSQLTPLETTAKDWRELQPIPLSELTPNNPALSRSRKILTRCILLNYDPITHTATFRGNDTYQGFTSEDGSHWTPVGPPIAITMPHTIAVGLTATTAGEPAEITYDHITPNLATSTTTPIGGGQQRSKAELHQDSLILRPTGGNDWLINTDKALFQHQPMTGDGEIVARLAPHNLHNTAKAGLMMRETLAPYSPRIALLLTPDNHIELNQRPTRGAPSIKTELLATPTTRWLKLVRRQHTITATLRDGEIPTTDKQLDLIGTLTWHGTTPTLTDTYERRRRTRRPVPPPPPGPRDTYIADLPTDRTENQPNTRDTFRISGVVTFMDRVLGHELLFIQDETGGTLLRPTPTLLATHTAPGRLIEASGQIHAAPGQPPLALGTLHGWGKMPKPLTISNNANAQTAESLWVETTGIGRSVKDGFLLIMGNEGLLRVWIGNLTTPAQLDACIDALVTVRGVYTTHLSPGPLILVPSPGHLQIREPAPADPFAIPSLPIGIARESANPPQTLHRIKLSGTITHRHGRTLYIQDDTAGARLHTFDPGTLAVGDHVEALGFPEHTGPSLALVETALRRTEPSKTPPKPATTTLDAILAAKLDSTLVCLDGVVLDQITRSGAHRLELQGAQRAYTAILSAGTLPTLTPGSRVRVTGVSRLQFAAQTPDDDSTKPLAATIDILLRTPADVALLHRAPWWNWRHTFATFAALAAILATAVLWIRTLRRRVEQRTRELRHAMDRLQKETETSATLAERDRLAAEIHDTLEQGLSGIMMQLDGLDARLNTDPDSARTFLEMARRMVLFSRSEVRHSLWNLESALLQNADLGAALTEIARQMNPGNTVHLQIEIAGTPRPLAPTVEHHLLRCTQEALANTLKHAAATSIRIDLAYHDHAVQLTLTDDGKGFDPASVMTEAGKHLGLRNLRSRSRKIKADLNISSQPGKGTTITLTVPNPAKTDKPAA